MKKIKNMKKKKIIIKIVLKIIMKKKKKKKKKRKKKEEKKEENKEIELLEEMENENNFVKYSLEKTIQMS